MAHTDEGDGDIRSLSRPLSPGRSRFLDLGSIRKFDLLALALRIEPPQCVVVASIIHVSSHRPFRPRRTNPSHRNKSVRKSVPIRHHRTIQTERAHPVIRRSWVRSHRPHKCPTRGKIPRSLPSDFSDDGVVGSEIPRESRNVDASLLCTLCARRGRWHRYDEG